MDETIARALDTDRVIDITTTGRRSGRPRRIETWFYRADGKLYLTGLPSPRKRDWLANIEAQPSFTFHLKGAVKADLPATGRVITDPAERRTVLGALERSGWVQARAARALGISERSMWYRVKKLGLKQT